MFLAAFLSAASAAQAQDVDAVRAVLLKASAAPQLDRAQAVEVLTVLAADGFSPEETFLVSLLAADGQGRIKIPFKDQDIVVPRATYDAQRLMERLLSPLDLTRLWLKGPESMADLRDLARLSAAFDARVTAFIAGRLAAARGRDESHERDSIAAIHEEALRQLTPLGSTSVEVDQAKALLASAIDKMNADLGVIAPTGK